MSAAKVLAGVYQYRPLLGDTRANAVGSLGFLRPDAAQPDAPVSELTGFGVVPAMMNRHSLAITQQNHVGVLTEHGIEPVDLLLCLNQDILQRLAKHLQLVLRDDVRRREVPRVYTIVEEASAPRLQNLLRFGEQILADDVQLDAVAMRQLLRQSVNAGLSCGGHAAICNDSNPTPTLRRGSKSFAFYDCPTIVAKR